MKDKSQTFSNWLDDFFTSYYYHRPVNATFIGVHDQDHRLPDFSEKGAGDTLADMQGLLDRLKGIPRDLLSPTEQIDHKLAEGFLRIQTWEYQSNHFHRGNPSVYSGEAVFGVMSLFLSVSEPQTGQVESAIARMEAIPDLLAQGQLNVRTAPLAWTERAIRECEGGLAFLTEGVEQLATTLKIDSNGFKKAAEKAATAFAEFRTYLKTELRSHVSEEYSCGEEALDLYLHQGHFLDLNADEIAEYAEEQMAKAEQYLAEHAADFGVESRSKALAGLADIHPTVDQYYPRYMELWDQVRETVEVNELLTWPDIHIRYVPRPGWAQKAAPNLYFLFYRSPSVFNRKDMHDYLVTPIDSTMALSEQERLLRGTNDSTIKLNHVVHHGSIGHHVQNYYVSRAESRIGQVAAVDCASRIAMFCGGTMAEGWACYATDLMSEIGFLTPLEQYAEYQSRMRMAARAVVDVRLHKGNYTLQEAAAYYEKHAGMSTESAFGEAVKNSMFPGGALRYLMGTDLIHKLRKEMKERQGSDFSLRSFHDNFLSYGSIPVPLIYAEMKRKEYDK